jgi:hypothetical protein
LNGQIAKKLLAPGDYLVWFTSGSDNVWKVLYRNKYKDVDQVFKRPLDVVDKTLNDDSADKALAKAKNIMTRRGVNRLILPII